MESFMKHEVTVIFRNFEFGNPGFTCICLVLLLIFQNTLGGSTHRNTKNDEIPAKWSTLNGLPSKIIGHRGEKVLMPQHTLGSYEIACIENPDFVEPDLVMTNDSRLVCFHDLTLRNSTDIESIEELAYLKGQTVKDDWFIPDLTLEQIKKVKVKQEVVGIRPQYFNNLFTIPTFEEFLELIHEMSLKMNKGIGIIPELKHPELVNGRLGKPHFMEDAALKILRKYGYPLRNSDPSLCVSSNQTRVACGPVVLQSFNQDAVKYLSTQTDLELMMLVGNDPMLLTVQGLSEISTFAHHYSVWKEIVYSGVEAVLKYNSIKYNSTEVAEAGGFIPTSSFSKLVHSKGMELSIYTIYDSREPSRRGCEVKCQPENKTEELFYYFGLGVDSMFVENIAEAIELRIEYDLEQEHNNQQSSASKSIPFAKTIFGIFTVFLGYRIL